MRRSLVVGAIVLVSVSVSWTLGAERAAAQGPAGAGASVAAHDSSQGGLSLNPTRWFKKDSADSTDGSGYRSEVEKKLTPSLQQQGLLSANTTVTDACSSFWALIDCLAALHASHNLGVDFNCLRANETGVHTSTDVSGCKAADGDKAQALNKSIHQLKPDADAKRAARDAEQQAKGDLKSVGA